MAQQPSPGPEGASGSFDEELRRLLLDTPLPDPNIPPDALIEIRGITVPSYVAQTPAAIAAVPIQPWMNIVGRRVIAVTEGWGLRNDLRATKPVREEGRFDNGPSCSVSSEQDWYWYRHSDQSVPEERQIILPIKYLYVEELVTMPPPDKFLSTREYLAEAPSEDVVSLAGVNDGKERNARWLRRIASSPISSPLLRVPVRAHEAHNLIGQRVIVVDEDGERRDMRAMSEPVPSDRDGSILVRCAPEWSWYIWWDDEQKPAAGFPVQHVWVE